MATEQQNHLKSVTEQAQGLVTEINQLEGAAKSKREMLLKLQGIVSISSKLVLNYQKKKQQKLKSLHLRLKLPILNYK